MATQAGQDLSSEEPKQDLQVETLDFEAMPREGSVRVSAAGDGASALSAALAASIWGAIILMYGVGGAWLAMRVHLDPYATVGVFTVNLLLGVLIAGRIHTFIQRPPTSS